MVVERGSAIAKDRDWKYWSESLQANERRAKMFKIAKQMRKRMKNIVGSKYLKNENGTLKMKEEKVMERWRSYFYSFLNEINEYQLKEEDKVVGAIWGVTKQVVERALKSMKVGKAPGLSGVTSDLIKAAGATGVKVLFQVCESIEQEGEVPEQWAKSYTIPAYNGKGDVLMVDL